MAQYIRRSYSKRKRNYPVSVLDGTGPIGHRTVMLSKDQIVAVLQREVAAKRTTQTEIGKVVGLPQSRISELFKGERNLSCDEAKALVEFYRISEPVLFSSSALQAILAGMLSGIVQDRALEQELPVLASTLQYMLQRISANPALADNLDDLKAAARVAAAQPDLPTR